MTVFTEEDVVRPDFAHAGYTRGVPMGGDLTNADAGDVRKIVC
jgi:hypothetical protein